VEDADGERRVNPLVEAIPPSLIRAINSRKREGDLDFGLGEPRLRPDPRAFEEALEWVREHGCPYSPNAGYPELRERIAGYLGLDGGAEAVCVTVGSEEALYLAIKSLLDPARDEVLIVEPCYLAYPKLCMMEGVRYRTVALDASDGFVPRAERVLEALRPDTRLIILNTPSNPTGRIWSDEELEKLGRGLARRGGEPVHILADEVYRELYYTPTPPSSPARFHPHTLVAGSLSKSSALTGLRLGWLGGQPAVVRAAVKVHQFVNTAASTLSQQVALAIFRRPESLAAQRAWYLRARGALLAAASSSGVPLLEPDGAFYALVPLAGRSGGDSVAAAERLLEEERVVTVPGRAFGESAEGWLRLSWVVDEAEMEEGLRRIGRFLARR
jgi:aspartate/methionine/tyrosine aminotransferase